MGVLTIIWTIWDAVNDPMMGALMDKAFAKKQTKNGKFRPWLLRATPLLASYGGEGLRTERTDGLLFMRFCSQWKP